MQSPLLVPASSPPCLAAEDEHPWTEAAWESSVAAGESYEAPEGSSVTAETSYEAAGYFSEASQDVSGAAAGLSQPAVVHIEAAEDRSSSCSDPALSNKASVSRFGFYSSDAHVDCSSKFSFALTWAQVTKEVLTGAYNTFKIGRYGGSRESGETAAAVSTAGTAAVGGAEGPTASSARSVAGKGSVSRMAADRLKELPSRIPKPSKGSAGGAVKRGTRPAAASACLPPSLIPKPRSAKTAPAALAISGMAHAAVVTRPVVTVSSSTRQQQERRNGGAECRGRRPIRANKATAAAARPPWRPAAMLLLSPPVLRATCSFAARMSASVNGRSRYTRLPPPPPPPLPLPPESPATPDRPAPVLAHQLSSADWRETL
ncbi:unnamed protein product [Closterium sp. Naga37s-1]|nr:unnamed protein product [Closterium sp. Naga37s-1]